jgi:hypothetical protein
MEVEAQMGKVKRWEGDQKVAVVVRDKASKMAKVIRESRWNVKYEYDANHAKVALDRYCQELPKEERQLLYWLGKRSRDWFNHGLHQPIPVTRRLECRRTPSITIAAATPSVTIQHIRAINGRTGTCLKLKRVCDGI